MIALSAGLSWLIFGGWLLAVVLIVAFFMGATRGSRDDLADVTWSSVRGDQVLHVLILPAVYDWQTRGDFDHEPVQDWQWCDVCARALSSSFTNMADLPLAPRDAGALVTTLRRLAARNLWAAP